MRETVLEGSRLSERLSAGTDVLALGLLLSSRLLDRESFLDEFDGAFRAVNKIL